jgi:hypothetical protein
MAWSAVAECQGRRLQPATQSLTTPNSTSGAAAAIIEPAAMSPRGAAVCGTSNCWHWHHAAWKTFPFIPIPALGTDELSSPVKTYKRSDVSVVYVRKRVSARLVTAARRALSDLTGIFNAAAFRAGFTAFDC